MSEVSNIRPSTDVTKSSQPRQMEGKLAIVTGASRGIGRCVSEALAAKGCNVVLNYTSTKSTESTNTMAKGLGEIYGVKTLAVQADMGTEDGPMRLVQAAENTFKDIQTGKFRIDIIINNAGVSVNRPIAECNAEDFAFQYNVNVRGPLFLIKAAQPYLPHDRSGRIVNVSSVSSSIGFVGQSVYGGTKAALEAMTRTWARELSENATVNAVNPGPVATDMYAGTSSEFQQRIKPFLQITPLANARLGVDDAKTMELARIGGGRAAYSAEIAGLISLLCSEEAGWTTGSVLNANGGMKFSV